MSICFISQGLNKETIFARCLEDVDAASLHGRTDISQMNAGISRQFAALVDGCSYSKIF